MEMDLDLLKDEVWGKLAQLNVEELAEMCQGLSLTVPESKKGKKPVLYSAVMRQLTSEDVEQMEEAQEKEYIIIFFYMGFDYCHILNGHK